MPLKVVQRSDSSVLWIKGTVRPAGSGKVISIRQSSGTTDRRLAGEAAAILEARIMREAWHGKNADAPARTLPEAIESYQQHVERSPGTQALLTRILIHFGNVPLSGLTQEAVDKARGKILRPDASPSTVRRNLIVPLRAVLVHANKRGWCELPRFDIPPEPKGRTLFMLPDQADAVIAAASSHLKPLLRFLVCTGCRMSEALSLDWRDVDLTGGRVILWEGETKGGSRRVVDLAGAAVSALAGLPKREGRVFVTHKGNEYRDSDIYGGQIKSAWRSATGRAGVSGFTPHHLRHTWASWHYAVYRDLLRLKSDGGWSSVALVERYAHIMPAGHTDGIRRVWGLDG